MIRKYLNISFIGKGDPMTEQEFLSNYEEQKEDIKFNKAIGNIFDSGEIMVEYMKDTGPNETFDKNKTFQEKLQDQVYANMFLITHIYLALFT